MSNKTILLIGAILLALGVGIGAFGAHGLETLLKLNGRLATFETAVLYHFVHSLGILIIGTLELSKKKTPVIFLSIGVLFFCGSLYLLSLTNLSWLGAVAPVGGTAFILGWLTLAWNVYHS